MDVVFDFFQAFFLLHAETLFLVDDEKTQMFEFDVFGEQRVRADNDVDCAVGEPFFGAFGVFSVYKA